MLKHHISGLPVIDNHAKLVGIITEGDFLRRAEIETERKRSTWLDALLGPEEGAIDYVHSHGLSRLRRPSQRMEAVIPCLR